MENINSEKEQKFVHLQGVHQWFGSGASRYYALEDVNLEIAKGEFISIIGHSGCGKSTLLNLVAGLSMPSAGAVLVNDKQVTGPGLDRAVVFQSHSLLPWLTVFDNVKTSVDSVHADKNRAFRLEETRKYVDMVHLSGHAQKKPGELSGGMKQRVGLARAFAADPMVMLLDEPFGALDALTRGFMQDELTAIWEKNKKTVIMITHDVDEAVFLSDRIVLMSNGPKARIAEIVDVNIPRPRTRESVMESPDYLRLRKELLHYLISTHLHQAA